MIIHKLLCSIALGDYKAGDKIPSMRRVCADTGASLTTTKEAFHALRDMHVVFNPTKNSGYIVTDIGQSASQNEIIEDLKEKYAKIKATAQSAGISILDVTL